jgi:hypothetical protein
VEAAGKTLPHAVQVADRWHLLRNLNEALTNTLAAHHSPLRLAGAMTSIRRST